jgi:hypothetical protein
MIEDRTIKTVADSLVLLFKRQRYVQQVQDRSRLEHQARRPNSVAAAETPTP